MRWRQRAMGMYDQPGMPFDPSNPRVTQALESMIATTFQPLHSVMRTLTGMAHTQINIHDDTLPSQCHSSLHSCTVPSAACSVYSASCTGSATCSPAAPAVHARVPQGPAPAPPNPSKKPLRVVFFLLAMQHARHPLHNRLITFLVHVIYLFIYE